MLGNYIVLLCSTLFLFHPLLFNCILFYNPLCFSADRSTSSSSSEEVRNSDKGDVHDSHMHTQTLTDTDVNPRPLTISKYTHIAQFMIYSPGPGGHNTPLNVWSEYKPDNSFKETHPLALYLTLSAFSQLFFLPHSSQLFVISPFAVSGMK